MSSDSDNARYLHLIRQDCPLPPGTHVVGYCRDSDWDSIQHRLIRNADRGVD